MTQEMIFDKDKIETVYNRFGARWDIISDNNDGFFAVKYIILLRAWHFARKSKIFQTKQDCMDYIDSENIKTEN